MDYESNEFLVDGSVARTYDELSYHDKIKVRALQGLDQLAASLNAISNIKAIEFQINHLNEMSGGFNQQLEAKDEQIQALTNQLATIENTQAASKALLEAEIASLKAANESLTDNFNKFRSVIASIDSLTDEVID